MIDINKPKLVYFQRRYEGLPDFVLLHYQQQVNCLAQFFEVIVINQDCDYQEICDQYQPDITLFEIGISTWGYTRLTIKNTSAYPEIPKLGFYNADCFCEARSAFISDMENWGITTLFSMSVPLAEYIPDIAENIFTWANFIDPDIYQDYGYPKVIPVLFTGSTSSFYPWRRRIKEVISQHYPSLISPHFGYEKHKASRMIYGQQYARMINSSWFVPACGTVVKEVVRKQFEIPACKSCLITEKTPALEAAGFVDMQNCVFADESDVLDKIDYLFQNPEQLEKIIDAGYQLVHSQHTFKQRDQILQWFNLHKILKPGQRIVQENPFGRLTIVEESSGIKNAHIIGDALDRVLLRQGDEKLWAGKYDEAEAFYLNCINSLMGMLPEPKLRLAICNLYKGNAKIALSWILQPIECILVLNQASEPDPVEWAYFIITLLCQGKLSEARKRANQFPLLSHPELDRTRWVIDILENPGYQINLPNSNSSNYRLSIHHLPQRSINEWLDNVCTMLKACKQITWAETLSKAASPEDKVLTKQAQSSEGKMIILMNILKKKSNCLKKINKNIGSFLNNYPSIRSKLYALSLSAEPFYITLIERLIKGLTLEIKSRLLKLLNGLENVFGYFLPYHLSAIRNDEFFSAIYKLALEENLRTCLIVGASAGEGITEACLAGTKWNCNKPTVYCINLAQSKFIKLQQRFIHNNLIRCYEIFSESQNELIECNEVTVFNKNFQLIGSGNYSEQSLICLHHDVEVKYGKSLKVADKTINKIQQEDQIDCFDMVAIDSSELNFSVEIDEIYGAKYFILDNINNLENYNNVQKLLTSSDYTLISQNTFLHNGYAILKRVDYSRTPLTIIDFDFFENSN